MNAESTGSGAAGKILLPDPRPIKPASEPGSAAADTAMNSNADPSPLGGSTTTEPEPGGPRVRTKYPPSFKAAPSLSNKSRSTLVSLGVSEPYFMIKSKRRSRRPFTPTEDEALLKGYAVHGFQWTLIQQDKHLNLSHRRATDLRDRFRTKFPHAYREGGSVSGKAIVPHQVEVSPGKLNSLVEGKEEQPPRGQPLLSDVGSTPNEKRRSTNNADTANLGSGAISSLPLSAPVGSLDSSMSAVNAGSAFQFPLDENPTIGGTGDPPWEDNTLPPLVWDELG
jgi:Myb-like DNA-binding domain